MNQNDDSRDVDAVLAGDLDAFARIVNRWQSPIVNLAYRYCGDRHRAEDLAQEAFLRAYRNLASWRRDAAFSTWLFALAANLCRTEIRRIPPRFAPIDGIAVASTEPQPGQALSDHQRGAAVRAAVASLPEKYRDPVLLFYFHHLGRRFFPRTSRRYTESKVIARARHAPRQTGTNPRIRPMNDDRVRQFLDRDSIVPSSGFTASVMDALRREAQTPPPIPFPWKRAALGLAASAAVAVFAATSLPPPRFSVDPASVWAALGVVVAVLSAGLPLRYWKRS